MKKTLLPLSNNITNSIPKSKKQVSIKPKLITKYRLVFETLKEKLCSILILVFLNFEYLFILYYNSSKKCKYNIVLYQIRENSIKYFILYLLKVLNLAKKNYQSTKLKTKIVVQILQKLPYYLNKVNFKIYINH